MLLPFMFHQFQLFYKQNIINYGMKYVINFHLGLDIILTKISIYLVKVYRRKTHSQLQLTHYHGLLSMEKTTSYHQLCSTEATYFEPNARLYNFNYIDCLIQSITGT